MNTPDPFDALREDIARHEHSLAELDKLARAVSDHPDAFDDDDAASIKNALLKTRQRLRDMQEDLERRSKSYETTIVAFERALETREALLEQFDDVLSQNPELMEALATKQAALTQTLQSMRDQVLSSEHRSFDH